MRDFYELINQYPWTTIFLAIFIYEVIKLYKVTIFGESFLIGWFPFSSRWYNKLKIIK